MPSEFGQFTYVPDENGAPEPLDIAGSGRFDFYRVRIFGRLHFLKRLKPEYLADLQSRDALLKEFRTGYLLDHPGIVRYLRYDDTGIYEEYVDGKTIRTLIDGQDPSVKSAKELPRLARELLEALAHLHANGVLHLDLKPENVMLTRVGSNIKIIDLGCCVSSACDATPGYTKENMAPEQAVGGATDASTDLYLAGRIIRELALAAGCERKWRKYLGKLANPDPRRRFHSAEEAIKALPRKGKRKWMVAAAATVGVICAGILAGAASYFFLADRGEGIAAGQGGGVKTDTLVRVVREVAQEKNPNPASAPGAGGAKVAAPTVSAPAVPRQSSEERIRKQLKNHIFDYYRRNVKPVCELPPESFQDKGTTHTETMHAAMYKAIDDAEAYAARLKRENPAQADIVDAQLYSVIDEAQRMTLNWYKWK